MMSIGDISLSFSELDTHIEPIKINKICLVDADFMKYLFLSRMSYSLSAKLHTPKERIDLIEETAENLLNEILIRIHDPMIFCFSGKSYNTFRYHLAVGREYKGNRTHKEFYEDSEQDLMRFMLKVMRDMNCLLYDDLEADDLVSMLSDKNTYVYSHDKDLKQIPGFHVNIKSNELYEISFEEANRFLAIQIVSGDPTDNIIGIPGIGPVGAENIFKNVLDSEVFQTALNCYVNEFGYSDGFDRFIENSQLVKLRINREGFIREKYRTAFELKQTLTKLLN